MATRSRKTQPKKEIVEGPNDLFEVQSDGIIVNEDLLLEGTVTRQVLINAEIDIPEMISRGELSPLGVSRLEDFPEAQAYQYQPTGVPNAPQNQSGSRSRRQKLELGDPS